MSSSNSQRYLPRAPRYKFQSGDQTYLRYASLSARGQGHYAAIRDLSETGLSFALSHGSQVEEGDVLKLEFLIPGRKQIACFATVVRVEDSTKWDPEWGESGCTFVGLQFRHLPLSHLKEIRNGLEKRLQPEEGGVWKNVRRKQAVHLAGISVAMTASLFAMACPFQLWLKSFHDLF